MPDDCYAAIPNQLGIDLLDIDDAMSECRNNMCSADLADFIEANHLDRAMPDPEFANHTAQHINPRTVFGTATPKDAIYNTPRAWYMQRHLNPSDDWDSPAAQYRPDSQDMPWAREPESKVTIEDVAFLMGSHFQGTPFDPYGTTGTAESRHRYRPIGVNRTGQMVCMQIRPYAPAAYRSIMWVSYGSGAFTTPAPFYANVTDTPAYLRDTDGENASTNSLYWTNRILAVMPTRITMTRTARSNSTSKMCRRMATGLSRTPTPRFAPMPTRWRATPRTRGSRRCVWSLRRRTRRWQIGCRCARRRCSIRCSTRRAISCTTRSR